MNKYYIVSTSDCVPRYSSQEEAERFIKDNNLNAEVFLLTKVNKTMFDFESLWKRYPKRLGKKEALRHFRATVKTDEDWQNINKALDNYLQSKNVKENTQFIQHGSTWFNNWQDWIELEIKKETPSALAMLKEKNLI
ncbi:MAG: hypothetical protein PHS34_09535 [Candidatus Omnitrophica bacterium]|nr:hypothetical protein [Candidatus Omnitrophota bacterium]